MSDNRYLFAFIAYLLWLLLCWLLVKYLDKIGERLVSKTPTKVDNIILREVQFPVWLILIIVGFFVVARTVGLPPKITPYINRFTQLSVSFFIIYFVLRLGINLIRLAGETNTALKNMVQTMSRFTNILTWIIASLMLMDIFGISLTPVLASLGIAGIAIGLALQDTLSNFFAGLYILINQPIRIGDFVELENGLKGHVQTIGWRETRLQTPGNNTVVVPNAKLSQSVITNYSLPETALGCSLEVTVSYDSDLDKVERVTIEAAKIVLATVPGGAKGFVPSLSYHNFSESGINFSIALKADDFNRQGPLIHELIKALQQRYKKEGIVIPFAVRPVYRA
jgi:small-conductance mechanosensitive channel